MNAHLLAASEADGAHRVVGIGSKRRSLQLVYELGELGVRAAGIVDFGRGGRFFVGFGCIATRLERLHHHAYLVGEVHLLVRLGTPSVLVVVGHEVVRIRVVSVVDALGEKSETYASLGRFAWCVRCALVPNFAEFGRELGIVCLELFALLGLVVCDDPFRLF